MTDLFFYYTSKLSYQIPFLINNICQIGKSMTSVCYSLEGSGSTTSTFALLCSQMQSSSLSLFLLRVPRNAHSLLPTCSISHSTSTSMPAGMGRMYVVLRVRLTPMVCQKPGLLTSTRTKDVQKSSKDAAAPPWRLLKPLVCLPSTVKENFTEGWGRADDADRTLMLGMRLLIHR